MKTPEHVISLDTIISRKALADALIHEYKQRESLMKPTDKVRSELAREWCAHYANDIATLGSQYLELEEKLKIAQEALLKIRDEIWDAHHIKIIAHEALSRTGSEKEMKYKSLKITATQAIKNEERYCRKIAQPELNKILEDFVKATWMALIKILK